MTRRSRSRGFAGFAPTIAIATLVLLLAACNGSTASPEPTTGDLPAPTLVPIDQLLGDIAGADGSTVAVNGFLLITESGAQLCGIVLESYPPQCGGPTIRVLGEVPAEVLDALDKTAEPGLSQARWGWVDVVGTVDATGADGTPTITIDSIAVAA